jgi:hypothetical protein
MKLLQPVLHPDDVETWDPDHGPWELVDCKLPFVHAPGSILDGLKCLDPREPGDTSYDPDEDYVDPSGLRGLLLGPKYVGVCLQWGSLYIAVWDRSTGLRLGYLNWQMDESVSQALWHGREADDVPGYLIGHDELVAKLVSLGL